MDYVYKSCIGSLIYLIYTRVNLSFSVHKLANFSSNPGKVNFEGLVHLLRYIRHNKTLGLKYYDDVKDAPLSDLLRQYNIKTKNQLMAFSDFIWKDCPFTGRIIWAYIIFYQGRPIYHGTPVPGPVSESIAESEYNAACTEGMYLSHFRMLIHELLSKDPDIFPWESSLIILDSKSAVCMAKNGKDANHTKHIAKSINFVRNGEKLKMYKIDWCEGGQKLGDIAT